jgi:hypothetical protein
LFLADLVNEVVAEVLGIAAISGDEEKAVKAFLVSTERLLPWAISCNRTTLLPPLFVLFESLSILSLHNTDCKRN